MLALVAITSAQAAASLSPSAISVTPGGAAPGDNVTLAVTFTNTAAATTGPTNQNDLPAGATVNVTATFTNKLSGASFQLAGSVTSVGVISENGGTGAATGAFTLPTQTLQAGEYTATVTATGARVNAAPGNFYSQSGTVLTVTGKPDMQITALDYAAGTSYVGGTIIPMSLTFRNNQSTGGTQNVPYTPGLNGQPTFVRIQVVLSTNPTFGDADDFQLTILNISGGSIAQTTADTAGNRVIEADSSSTGHTFNWNQVLPGNLTGSFYVLAKMDSLNALSQNDPGTQTVNGNNIWGGNTLNPSGTLINLLPSNFPTTSLASHTAGGTTSASGYSDNPSISEDGRYVAFASDSTDLVTGTSTGGADTNGFRDIFLFDSQTNTVRRISLSQQSAQGNGASNNPAVSGNGRYVAFSSDANNLVIGDTNGFSDIYVANTLNGLISRVSGINASGSQANNPSFRPSISRDGRYIVYESTATNLVTGLTITSGVSHVYLFDRDVNNSGTFDTAGNTATYLVDVDVTAPTTTAGNANAIQATISLDGSTIAFSSKATNLVTPATTSGRQNVYVRPRANVNTATSGIKNISVVNGTVATEGNADSQTPSMSANGNYVAFASLATNLVSGDTNGVSDIFVYDNTIAVGSNKSVTRMSVSTAGVESYDPSPAGFKLGSINPTISSDGRYVAFASLAANLSNGDSVGQNAGNGATATATVTGNTVTGITPVSLGTQYSQNSPPIVIITGGGGSGATAVATVSHTQSTNNTVTGTVTGYTVTNGGSGYTSAPTVIIASDTNNAVDVFVHDRQVSGTGAFDTPGNIATTMASVNPFGYQTTGLLGVASTAASNIYPVISANGRFVAFPTDAENNAGLAFGSTNLLPRDSNGLRDVFLFDRRTNATVTPATPPTITITNPGNGGKALVNTSITISASATTTVGQVANVQFFVDGNSLGTTSTFPYSSTWTPTAVGVYNLSALVTDTFGNIGVSANVAVTITAAPSVGLTSPANGTSISFPVSGPVTVAASAAATTPGFTIQNVKFYANGTQIGAAVTTAPYTVAWTPTATGTYTLTAIATDQDSNLVAGTSTTSTPVTVTVAAVGGSGGGGGGASAPPTVSLSTPPAFSSVNARVTLSATATAFTGLSITNVEFLVNGSVVGSSTTAPYTTVWTPPAIGTYSITARATDNQGGVTISSPAATVSVTGTLSLQIVSPTSGAQVFVNTPQTVTANASFTNGTITSVQFFANGSSIGIANSYPYTIQWTPATSGTFSITAIATDNTGAQVQSSATILNVLTGTAPAVGILSPAASSVLTAGQPEVIVATASAGSGAVAKVDFFANGTLIGSSTTYPYNFEWTPTTIGPIALSAVATDTLGNRMTSTVVNVTVAGRSASAPTVSIASPLAGAALPLGITSTITALASDSDGTVASVQFLANGALIGTSSTFPFNTQFTPRVPGTYVLTARATDNGGNIANSASVTVTVVGGSAPTVVLTNPANGVSLAVNTPQTITANATSSSGFIASVQFLVNGVALPADTTFPYSVAWTPTALGTYSLTARATDNLGNITDSAPIIVTAATSAPPVVALTNPLNGTSFTVGTTLTLAASASDPDGTVASVQFLVNGIAQGSADTSAPYTAAWTPGAAGVYTITAQATDNTGNVSTSAAFTITIGSNASPTVELTSPSAGNYALGNQVLISATAADSDGTVSSVQFFANGLSVGTATAVPFNFSWRPTVSGNYRITAIATDNAGNTTTSAGVSVTVSAVPAPSAAITNPTAGGNYLAGNAIPIAVTTSGGNGPIAQVQFFINGASLATDTTFPYSTTWTPAAPGTYTLVAVVTDSAGISSNSSTLTLAIGGNQPPVVAMSGPSAGTVINAGSVVSLVATASDVDGTVASVRFLANGNPVGSPASAAPFTTAWTPTAPGTYSIVAQATDNSGNVTNSAPISVTVTPNIPPTITFVSPTIGTVVRTGVPVTLIASASDSDGVVASVQFFANGVSVAAPSTTVSPLGGYRAQFTTTAEGLYRLTAVAIDSAGATTTSSTVVVLSVSAASGATDNVYTGTYAGSGEAGRFAMINMRGKTAGFIGYSTTTPTKFYYYPGLALDVAGGFSLADSLGRTVISGNANDSGASGALDNNRAIFIGPVTFAQTTAPVASGYYTGSFSGRSNSMIAAIVGPDGSIMIYAGDGTFQAVGSGSIDPSGNFSLAVPGGARFAGKADPATGFLSGTLSGTGGGAFTAGTTSGAPFSDGFLRNLSTRGQVGTGSNILIAGFVVGGTVPKQVLVRAIGPTLSDFGVTGALADTRLDLFSGNSLVVSNDNWGGAGDVAAATTAVGTFPLANNSRDSAVVAKLSPGPYTVQISGVGGTTGIALLELYDVDSLQPFSTQKVMNVATRGVVGTGQGQLIAGFVVSGNTPKKVLIRGVGPTLAAAPFNVGGTLPDPVLRLVRSDGLIVRENDNWEAGNDAALISDASIKVGAFPLATASKDSAMLLNLPPGTYNAQVTGSGSTTGVALIEVYEIP